MCGIAGVLEHDGSAADRDLVARMLNRIVHRGPDASGIHLDGPVALGHVRLSIIDLEGGAQPMEAPGGVAHITFNGEIFNHVELREELAAKGHSFRTHSDTEVLLAAYLEWGERCVEHLNGQWAFAIWDTRTGTLFLSRDRLGIRPLYHAWSGQRFLFASEVKALVADPGVPARIDRRGLDQIFTLWTTIAPRTPYEGVSELPAGHSMTVRDGETKVWPHWELTFGETDGAASEDAQAESLLAALVDATRLRLFRSDVPVGAYLSGGLDSSTLCGIVRRYTDTRLRTFSVTFEDGEFDESAHQREVIEHLGVDHRQVRVTKDAICAGFPDVVRHAEQPILRTAPAPLFHLSRLVRESGFKVVLTGEGADEILGGYDLFKEAKIRRFWASQPDSTMRPKLLRRLYPWMPRMQAQSDAYLKAFFFVRPEDLSSPFFSHLPRWELTSKIKLFYSADTRAALEGTHPYQDLRERLPAAFGSWHPFQQAQYLEARYLMSGYLLSSQGDRMAMAHSVEGRFPFLDHRLVELAARIPVNRKMRVLDEKHLLKRAAGDLVPPAVRNRPKQPYRAPDAASFFDPETGRARAPWVEEVLSPERVARAGLFDPKAVSLLAQKARKGRAQSAKDAMALVGVVSTQLLAGELENGFRLASG